MVRIGRFARQVDGALTTSTEDQGAHTLRIIRAGARQ